MVEVRHKAAFFFFGGGGEQGEEIGISLCWNRKKFVAPKQQSYFLVVWGRKIIGATPHLFFSGLLFSWMNFKRLFVRKLLLFQTRIHLSAFARIKSTPKGKQNSPTLFMSAWNLR